MKKIITSFVALLALGTTANADFARVEMGAGVWQQTPTGYAERSDGDGVLSLDGKYTSSEKDSSEAYMWLLVKHPLPIIPNLRLEYVSVNDEGTTTGSVGVYEIPTSAKTIIETKQYDIIPYYNILDNTAWITLDLGLDFKVMESTVDVKPTVGFVGYSDTETVVVPLVYARGRVEIPTTNIGIETDLKAISYDGNTMYDVRAKVDYTFDISPVIQPGLEVGYRMQKLKVDDGSDAQVDLEYAGVYAGLMLRF